MKKISINLKNFIIVFSLFLFAPYFAAGQGQNTLTLTNPLCPPGNSNCPRGSDVYAIITEIINWLAGIGGIIAVGMIIWGAIQMITAGGNEEKIAKAKKTILWTTVGYAIILIGWGIETIIKRLLTP